jgi:hypothetical protein
VRARTLALAAPVGAAALVLATACHRNDEATPEQLQAQNAALERERDELKGKVSEMITRDKRLAGMPDNELRVGLPTPLVRTLIQRVATGFVDSVTLRLSNLKVHKAGTVKKVVTIGDYDLNVVIDEVSGKLKTGLPEVTFGGNQISVALPVQVVSGSGDATIDFGWDGKNVSGALCGDLQIKRKVDGTVKPAEYPVSGTLHLTATARQILAAPKFPVIKIKLKVVPSPESWATVQKILDDQHGICGFVLDKVNIPGVLDGLVGKGFDVRLPTEKLKPLAVPVGIAPTMVVRGEPLTIDVKVGHLAITEQMIWLGANVSLGVGAPPKETPAVAKE